MRSRNFAGLRRIPERGVIAGVCAGIADYFDWNVKLLRAVLVVVFLVSGAFPLVIVYCVLWYVMDPVEGDESPSSTRNYGGGDDGGLVGRQLDLHLAVVSMRVHALALVFEQAVPVAEVDGLGDGVHIRRRYHRPKTPFQIAY